jgi:hypothetical protein
MEGWGTAGQGEAAENMEASKSLLSFGEGNSFKCGGRCRLQ